MQAWNVQSFKATSPTAGVFKYSCLPAGTAFPVGIVLFMDISYDQGHEEKSDEESAYIINNYIQPVKPSLNKK